MNAHRGLGWLVMWASALLSVVAAAPRARVLAAQDQGGAPEVSAKYRARESYTTKENVSGGRIGPYRVAYVETLAGATEAPQAAAQRNDTTLQVIYAERPAEVSPLDDRLVTSVVRKYETVRVSPNPTTKPTVPPMFEGLLVWYEKRPSDPPLVVSLAPGRRLRPPEYGLSTRQVFFPDLTKALPILPARIGDTYRIDEVAAVALLGRPLLEGGLVGKIETIRDDPDDPKRKLIQIDITGSVVIPNGRAGLHARLTFVFTPERDADGKVVVSQLGVIDAPGWIAKVSLAQETVGQVVDAEGKSRGQFFRRELTLERRPMVPDGTLVPPASPPTPDHANSWLVYTDPAGRFHLEFPQEFQAGPAASTPDDPNALDLVRFRREGPDTISISLAAPQGLDGEAYSKALRENWTARGAEVIKGPAGWLPEKDWNGRRVYRFELAVVLPSEAGEGGARPRRHIDGYIVQGGGNQGLIVESSTFQATPGAFRGTVEEVLRTLEFTGSVGARP